MLMRGEREPSVRTSGLKYLPAGADIRCVILVALQSFCIASMAQTPNCDEGVIRLPDRSGTVVICSAVASKMPQLAKQLSDATRLLGSQQTQLTELTRLVRGLNGISKGIGVERQAQMLQNLSGELAAAQRGGDEKTKRAVEDLSEKIEELQSQMLSALTNQSSTAATATAIKGPVGDSIAKLEFSSAARQLGEINTRLQAIQGQISDVKNDTTVITQDVKAIQSSLKNVAKEVSDDPRKELVKRGYAVDYRGLQKAMREKDFVALEHFNNSGYAPDVWDFEPFLFYDAWNLEVFNALSPKLLRATEACRKWGIRKNRFAYSKSTQLPPIDREILQAQIRVCGYDILHKKLQDLLVKAKTDDSKYSPLDTIHNEYIDKVDIEALRKTVNPHKKDHQSRAKQLALEKGLTSYLDPCTFDRNGAACKEDAAAAAVPGISPESFTKIEQADVEKRRTWDFQKRAWIKEIEETIQWFKDCNAADKCCNSLQGKCP